MIYPSNYEEKTSFSKVRELVIAKCLCPLGVAKCKEMAFSSDYKVVSKALHQTSEMTDIIRSGLELPTDNLHDVTPYLNCVRAENSYLLPDQMYKIKMSLETMCKIVSFFGAKDDAGQYLYPKLSAELCGMTLFPNVVSAIDSIINKHGEIKDTASPELISIRRAFMSVNSSISSAMRRVVERGISEGFLDKDTSPSMRDGRLVIPVASMMKRKLNGIVHDESATGKTVYIEPAEIVEANNRLRELQIEEKREIIRILTLISSQIRPHIDKMLESYSLLGLFDFVRAKALFAIEVGGEMPVLEHKPEIDWFHAVHPILYLNLKAQHRDIVPLDIRLNRQDRILIISGPNAGGKSVCLKTVGLVQYMMQCGLLPTLYSNSHMGLFDNIFIDIGDEQSLENDLSTYSSHLKNMKAFMQYSTNRTLILIDEMGSGTEPQIGGALAQSILIQLNKVGVMGVVTTHYQNLKTFAESESGFVNGAMLYDRQKMQPLFQLSIGNPGSSFAIEIARKIGLPKNVIEDAQEIVGSDYINMDKYLLDLARDKRYWSNKRMSIKEKEQKLNLLLEKYEEKVDALREQRSLIISEARRQASEILSTTNATLERTIHEIRKSQAEKERTKAVRKDLEEYKRKLSKSIENPEEGLSKLPDLPKHKNRKKQDIVATEKRDLKFEVGEYVRMSDGGVVGRILSLQGKKAEVAFGALRTIVELSKLVKATKPKESASNQILTVSKSTSEDIRQRQLNFSHEIDVRGMRADEAVQAIIYFLDDAIQFNASKIRILHGTGTGVLKTVIREQLQSNPCVVSFHDEDVRFGGAGITVVNLA